MAEQLRVDEVDFERRCSVCREIPSEDIVVCGDEGSDYHHNIYKRCFCEDEDFCLIRMGAKKVCYQATYTVDAEDGEFTRNINYDLMDSLDRNVYICPHKWRGCTVEGLTRVLFQDHVRKCEFRKATYKEEETGAGGSSNGSGEGSRVDASGEEGNQGESELDNDMDAESVE